MDDRLRKLERALAQSPADVETKASLIAERVRLGRVTQQQVLVASMLGDPAALLLEPPVSPWWKPRDFLSITQGEMIKWLSTLAVLDKNKVLNFALDVVETAVIGINGFGHTPALLQWQEMQANEIYQTLLDIREKKFKYISVAPGNIWASGTYLNMDAIQAANAEAADTPARHLMLALSTAMMHIMEALTPPIEDEAFYRSLDNAISEVTDAATNRGAAANTVKNLLISYLVGDRE